jgi:translation initiation factor 3 subunit E
LYALPPIPKDADTDDVIVEDDRTDPKSSDEKHKTGNPNVYYLTSINKELLQILWGKLCCEILLENWDDSATALTAVKLSIEQLVYTNQMTALDALRQRTWLLHWSLFVFWNNSAKGLEKMVEFFFSEKYLQAITTNAPHLLRYLTAAVLLCKRRVAKSTSRDGRSSGAEARKLMRDLVRLMNNCEYTDPIVEFVECLCVKFDFEGAQEKLAECENVLQTDFFLCKRSALFMEEARVFVFENYCRIHDKVDISVLATKLAMDQEAAEHWIVDLIRNALLHAKIDSEQGCVVMGAESHSIYEQVMERTRDLNLRSASLVQNLKNFVISVKKEKVKKMRAAMENGE